MEVYFLFRSWTYKQDSLGLRITESPVEFTSGRISLLLISSLVVAWRIIPFISIIFLSSLQSIPGELYEASEVDGAGPLRSFFDITLPILRPAVYVGLVQTTMTSINVFDEIVSLSGYGYEGQTLLIYNYMKTFSFLDFGLGSAVTYIIMLISGASGILYIRSLTKGGAE